MKTTPHEQQLEFFATCPGGLEATLAEEMKSLGLKRVRPLKGGVVFFGDAKDAYRACLWLRTASRILMVLARVSAKDADGLYQGVQEISWTTHIKENSTLSVQAHGTNAALRNTNFTAVKVKDAICDQLREAWGTRPNVASERPDVVINVSLREEKATISIDFAGESLHRRGYREDKKQSEAPLKEALAAGIVLKAGWGKAVGASDRRTYKAAHSSACLPLPSPDMSRNLVFFDPLCGSGTLVLEAAMIAADRAPGLLRDYWGFQGWAQYDAHAFEALLQEADHRAEAGLNELPYLIASDYSEEAIALARMNAKRLGLEPYIEFAVADIRNAKQTLQDAGVVLDKDQIAQSKSQSKNAKQALHEKALSLAVDTFDNAKQTLHIEEPKSAMAASQNAKQALQSDEQVQESSSLSNAKYTLQNDEQERGIDFPDNAKQALQTLETPQIPNGYIVSNPPYGQRLFSEAQLPALYSAMAEGLAELPSAWHLALITPDASIDAHLGLVALSEDPLFNGKIETQLRVYQLEFSPRTILPVISLKDNLEYKLAVSEHNTEQFAARLRKNAKLRRKWASKEGVHAYRLYDADLPDYAVAIDYFEGVGKSAQQEYLVVSEYAAPAKVDQDRANRRFADVLAVAPVLLGIPPQNVFSRVRKRQRGKDQYQRVEHAKQIVYTKESGYNFELDLSGYLDTGLFLDHRITRDMVGQLAKGKRFLNLFCYTGSATVHAAGGGAKETTSVDLSSTYLDWAKRNMALNNFDKANHRFVRSDVVKWIQEERRARRTYDVIFVDPPTFSNSKAMGSKTWDIQRDHVELLTGVSRLLAKGGVAVFSGNLRNFVPNTETLERYGVILEDITAQTIPLDFERNPRIHFCYLVKRMKK